MTNQTKVEMRWRTLGDLDDEGWQMCRCLYAYQHPTTDEILYIGKSWGVTVRGRWNRAAKEKFWNDLESQRGIKSHIVLFGEMWIPDYIQLSHELLADVESLLIQQVSPWCNIQSIKSRITRPGLTVKCTGEWPHRQKTFHDR